MAEKFFWADAIAEQIIKRKGKTKNQKYVCASGVTPSGTVHIGNFREIITTDLVAKALKEKGKKVCAYYFLKTISDSLLRACDYNCIAITRKILNKFFLREPEESKPKNKTPKNNNPKP